MGNTAPSTVAHEIKHPIQGGDLSDVVRRRDIWSVEAHAVQAHQLTGVTVMVDDQRPTFRLMVAIDDVESRSGHEVAECSSFLDETGIVEFAEQTQTEVGNINERLAGLRLRTLKEPTQAFAGLGMLDSERQLDGDVLG